MFLLVPAYPGSPGSKAVKRLCCVCVCVCACDFLCDFNRNYVSICITWWGPEPRIPSREGALSGRRGLILGQPRLAAVDIPNVIRNSSNGVWPPAISAVATCNFYVSHYACDIFL